jgi:pimeloyl-ACP methyl ester carboxylesterase
MRTKNISSYKTEADRQFVENWIERIQTLNQSFYKRLSVETAFGETVVFSFNDDRKDLEPVVFLPGARLCGMSWDLNDNLKTLKNDFRLYLIDVIGQPGLSSGNSPDAKTDEFGKWIVEVLDGLNLKKTNVVGASFGGELGMKLARAAPERISKMVLMNPVGLSYISLAPRVTFYNLLPIILPSEKNVNRFMDNVAFAAPDDLPAKRREMLGEFILQTLTRFNFKADYPYKMPDAELDNWSVPTYLILGDADKLIPHRKTVERAKRLLKNLKDVRILEGIGHGIEMSGKATEILRDILRANRLNDSTAKANFI